MVSLKNLISGYKDFYQTHFIKDPSLYKSLWTNGQAPKTLVIACSDSRTDPSLITGAQPGDLFVIRNVANLVPPYQPDGESYHGTSAALEFAVCQLQVHNIVVLGHSGCAGIKALGEGQCASSSSFSFIDPWVNIAAKAKEELMGQEDFLSPDAKNRQLGKASILISMENLLTFPWIKALYDHQKLEIHGWYFCIETGHLEYYDQATKTFQRV